MSQHLRDYQVATADEIERQWQDHSSTLAVLATGLGKTVIFAEVIRRRKRHGRAMVIAHREELVTQARKKIEHFTGIECEIEMADQVARTSMFHQMPVVIATVQTLISGRKSKRMTRFDPKDFATIIFDEAHHGCANTWKSVLDHFKGNPDLKVLGVTATPDRTDEAALGQIFESTAANMGILEGVNTGWLVPVEQEFVTVSGLDFSGVHTLGGDLNMGELANIMEAERNLHGVCSATIHIAKERQTIVFAASVKHAEMACNILNRHKSGIAEWICGETPREQRRKIVENMHQGRTQILVNVGCATEGFDCPAVEVIVMARPTKSRSLFAQMAGRGTRPLPGIVDGPETAELRQKAIADSAKKSCLIVDFVGNSGKHKLISTLDLLGGKYPDEVRALAKKNIEENGQKDTMEALEEASEELVARRQKKEEEDRKKEEERKARIKAKATFSTKFVNPFDAYDIAPDLSQDSSKTGTLTRREKEILGWNNIDPEAHSYAECQTVLKEINRRYKEGRATLKQAKQLRRFGYDPEMPKEEAKRVMDAVAANGWRRPKDAPAVAPVALAEQLSEPTTTAHIEQDHWFD